MKYEDLITKYHNFVYHEFQINNNDQFLEVIFNFEIEGLSTFNPSFKISKNIIINRNINEDLLKLIIFNIGMMESISYYKLTCPKNYIIENYSLDDNAINWWKNIFYNGLGEFLYRNNINVSKEDLVSFKCDNNIKKVKDDNFKSLGNIIPIGGGKDSCVTLELLKQMDNVPFMINPKEVHLECINAANYKNYYQVDRCLDNNMLELNKEGYLNGHTPFSGLVAFYSYLVAYLTNRKFIVLSNEDSANEPTVLDTFVNHQYSKSFDFEKDFNSYVDNYIGLDIHYFSLLRPIKEIRIAYLFSKYNKYHHIFKSCNVGSKEKPWIWCGSCSKCLFVFSILSAFLPLDYLETIFNKNLFSDESLLETFKELLGFSKVKPFECVGECDEVKWAISQAIVRNKDNLPYLLQYYNDNYPLFNKDLLNSYNDNNMIPNEFSDVIKEMMQND